MDQHHYKFKTRQHGAEETRSDGLGRGEEMRDEVKDREGGLTFDPPESRAWGVPSFSMPLVIRHAYSHLIQHSSQLVVARL